MISALDLSSSDRFRFRVLIRSEIPVVYISLSEVYWANELLVLNRIFQYFVREFSWATFCLIFSFIDKSIHQPQQVDPIDISYIHSKKECWTKFNWLSISWHVTIQLAPFQVLEDFPEHSLLKRICFERSLHLNWQNTGYVKKFYELFVAFVVFCIHLLETSLFRCWPYFPVK